MRFDIAAALAVLAVQPAVATIDFAIGTLVWGSFGIGAQQVNVLLPGPVDGPVCNNVGRRLFQHPANKPLRGNFVCKGCSGSSDPKQWSVTELKVAGESLKQNVDHVSGTNKAMFEAIYKSGNNWAVKEGNNGRKMGNCKTWIGRMTSCDRGLDRYRVYRYLRCEGVDIA